MEGSKFNLLLGSLLTVLIYSAALAAEGMIPTCVERYLNSAMVKSTIKVPAPYELPGGRKASKYKKFINEISELRVQINEKIGNKLDQVESSIYPAAGFDSGYPFLITPNAKVVVALDDNSFISEKSLKMGRSLKPVQPYGFSTFMHFSEIVNLPDQTHQIVANIKGLDKNIRIRSVQAFTIEGEAKFIESGEERIPIHGLVRFDRGEGTAEQIYVHVNRFFTSLEPTTLQSVSNLWWMKMLPPKRLALLFKGNEGIRSEPIIDALEQIFVKSPGSVYVAAENEATVRYLRPRDQAYVPLEDSKRGYKEVRMPYFHDPSLKKYRIRAKLGYGSVGSSKGWADIVVVPE